MTSTRRLDHQELEARRLRAAELFVAGVGQAEAARELGVTRQSVHHWHARWRQGGVQALRSRGPTGYPPRLSDTDLERLTGLLLEGAAAHRFTGELWTVARVAQLIAREFEVTYHPSHVWWLLRHRLGFQPAAAGPPSQGTRPGSRRPMGQGAVAQDQGNARRRRACLVFFDESGVSLLPNVRRTWAPRGQSPVLRHRFNWKRASMAAALCYGVGGAAPNSASMSKPATTTPTA